MGGASDTLRVVSASKPLPIAVKATAVKVNGTGAAAIATSMTVPEGATYRLKSVSLKMSAAPTTSQDLTITLNANAGAAYDAVLYRFDLSVEAVTSLVWFPDEDLDLEAGDAIDVCYTNTDVRTYGVQITAEVM